MRIYVDSSCVIKRVIAEEHSEHFIAWMDSQQEAENLLVSSSLAWIEVTRALRNRLEASLAQIAPEVDGALSGVAEYPITPQVVSLARRVDPTLLRSLDAMHVATAILLDVDQVVTYDDRLAAACEHNGLIAVTPRSC